MKRIDLHNVVLFVVFFLVSLLAAVESRIGWRGGVISAIVTFVFLAGRVLMHGFDLSRTGPAWKSYVGVNLLLNVIAAAVNLGVFVLTG